MTFDLQPTLTGDLVVLRPLRAEDWAALFAVGSDPLIWEQHPARDRYQEPAFRKFFDDGLSCGGAFVVIERATGAIIGSSRYFGYDPARSEVEIGWTFLARAYWGGRYNGEMKRLMIDHALQHVDRVVFMVGPNNIRSQRAVERIGGVRAGAGTDSRGHESMLYEIRRAPVARSFWSAALAFAALPGVLAYLGPWLLRPSGTGAQLPGVAVVAFGSALLLWCVRDFYVAGRGTLAPWAPPQRLVTVGLYKYSRNPMYVAVLVVLAGWALAFSSAVLWIYTWVAAAAFHLRVVLSEEPYLARTHGAAWTEYRRRVARWWGRPSGRPTSQCSRPSGWLGRRTLAGMNRRHSALTDWGLGHVTIRPGDDILDAGCGGGRTVAKLAAAAVRGTVAGIDHSAESVTATRRENAEAVAAGRVRVEQADVAALPFADGGFDLVTAVETHFWWPDLGAGMRELRRVLKPGGRIVVIAEFYNGGKHAKTAERIAALTHIGALTVAQHRAMLTDAGFVDVQIDEDAVKGWICCVGAKA